MTGFQVDGTAYDRFMGRYSERLAPVLCETAGVSGRALDVGCGPGALSGALAARLGPAAVTAVDPSESFVAACRARVPQADVRQATAEDLPFDDDSFDAALAQLVVNFMRDPQRGAAEMRRVTAPGGTVAAAVWDYAGAMTMLRRFWDAARELRGPSAPDEGRVMRYGSAEELEALWREAGLTDVRTGPLDVTVEYEDFDDLWEPFTHGVGPAGAFVAQLEPAERERLRDLFRAQVGEPEGAFALTARAWSVVGRA